MNLPARTQIARVLCPIDFSECSEHALKHAAAVARWYGAHLRVLHVFAVAPPVSMLPPLASPPPAFALSVGDRQQVLNHMRQLAARTCGHDAAEMVVQESAHVAVEILDQALAWHADLLVMGNHGHSGITRLVLGSVSEKVLRMANCPVLVVPHHAAAPVPPGDIEFDRILCAIDFSKSSLAALSYALSLGAEAGAHVTLLNILELPPELRETPTSYDFSIDAIRVRAEAGQLDRLEALIPFAVRDYCTVESTVVEGKASREILRQAAARQSDLIVIGVQGRSAINLAVFGSNAQDVIRQATCPVLLVRARNS